MSDAVDKISRVGLHNPVNIVAKFMSLSGGEDRRTLSRYDMIYHSKVMLIVVMLIM